MQEGVHTNTHGIIYPEICYMKRTDRCQNIIQNIINMISQFPLDYLHIVCLGVVQKIIHIWIHGEGRFSKKAKLQSSDIRNISEQLIKIAETQP